MSDPRRTARAGRPAAAFAELRAEVLDVAIPYGPGGHAVAPAALLVDANARQHAATPLAELTVGPDRWLAIRSAGSAPPEPPEAWRTGVLRLRLGLSQWLLDRCLDHLGERTSGGIPLISHQLVRVELAEAAADQLIVELSTGGLEPAGLHRLHERLLHTDRALLRLLGAAGYRSDGPGQVALLSELLADVYSGAAA
ncbi:acyl-CoA dehydrogenase family protein [Micromonospora sp. CPCC 205539]|uniref:acyl-CoA dehydrogenase family protein n=1 Tax=Micromonospora sp. CPCC 205539 TaxID=3122408 RepID=UPI002FF1AE59